MKRTFTVACGLLAVVLGAHASEEYEGSYSASFPSEMQSCQAAQAQAERLVREHFGPGVAAGGTLSVGGKRCECAANYRYRTPLFDCMGYAVGRLSDAAPFDDSACVSLLTADTNPATFGMRMPRYLSCVRRLPGFNRGWEPSAMQRVRDEQQAEGGQ